MKRFEPIVLGSLLLAGTLAAPVQAASDWESLPGQAPVYATADSSEPTCCYSEDRIWRHSNNESRWSTRGRHFSPYGFANREGYRPSRPAPLPRGTDPGNPWAEGEYVQRIGGRQTGRGNAEFFRPAYYNYPPPVGPVPGGLAGDPLDPLLMLPTPPPGLATDPYLGGLYLPGLAGPVGPWGPWGAPGMVPGMWPGLW